MSSNKIREKTMPRSNSHSSVCLHVATVWITGYSQVFQDLDCIWLKERRLLSGSCCNIMAVLFCLRVMSEIEEKAEEMIRKYRARQVSITHHQSNKSRFAYISVILCKLRYFTSLRIEKHLEIFKGILAGMCTTGSER